jgi:rod shape-determining protein MreD
VAAIAAAAVLYLAATFQTSLAWRLAIGPATPDLLLVAVVCIGLVRGPSAGLWTGFGGGLFLGLLLGQGITGTAIGLMVVGLVAGHERRWLWVEHWLAAPLSVLFLTPVAGAIISLLSRPAAFGLAMKIAAASAVYNAALSPLVFALTRRVHASFRHQEA